MENNIEHDAIVRRLDEVTLIDSDIKLAYRNMVKDRYGSNIDEPFDAIPRDLCFTPFVKSLEFTTTNIVTLNAKANIVKTKSGA